MDIQIRQMWLSAIDADRSIELWTHIGEYARAASGAAILDRHSAFFNVIRRTSFINSVISLSRFVDKPKSSASIHQILKPLRKDSSLNKLVEFIDHELAKNASTWDKIQMLRHECYAHSNKGKMELEILASVGLTAEDTETLVNSMKAIVFRLGVDVLEVHLSMEDDRKRVSHDFNSLLSELEKCK